MKKKEQVVETIRLHRIENGYILTVSGGNGKNYRVHKEFVAGLEDIFESLEPFLERMVVDEEGGGY